MKRVIGIIAMICIPLIAWYLTIFFRLSYFFSIILFFGFLSAFFVIQKPSISKRTFIFAAFFSIPLCIAMDIIAIINKSFLTTTIFQIKFLNLISIEDFLYAFFWVFSAVLFHNYFKLEQKDLKPFNMKWLMLSVWSMAICVIVLFFISPRLLHIPYFFLLGGSLWTIPLILLLCKHPSAVKRYFFIAIYFFFFFLLFELAALRIGQWVFPGNEFIGFIHMFGQSFPIEELVLWMVFGTPALLAYYEFFKGDKAVFISVL